MLAAKGADSERMSRWSKRNVFPSKIALGVIFAILGGLVLSGLGAHLAGATGSDMITTVKYHTNAR
ncbi:MAG: hypothetical protein IKC14_07455, partial [Kiritimatiellae bacterium]|nr:hypothetical protein [Kiritimatiellia bacterium]